jgi:hypothetical protein
MCAGGVPLRVDSRCIDLERTGKRAMSISGIDLIAVAFGAFNVLRLASYFPQIVAVACDRHGATAISFSCWSIWIGANATTALYAWVNLGDLPLAAISAFNAACCTAVLLLAAYKRTAIRCRQTARIATSRCVDLCRHCLVVGVRRLLSRAFPVADLIPSVGTER